MPANIILASANATLVTPVAGQAGNIFVNPVHLLPDGTAQFFFASLPDGKYVIQATTNLVDWVNILTNMASGNFMDLVDADAVHYPYRFYRTLRVESATGRQISSLQLSPVELLTFGYLASPGRAYALQSSTNLIVWENLTTNLAGGGLLGFTNAISPAFSERFFRVLELP